MCLVGRRQRGKFGLLVVDNVGAVEAVTAGRLWRKRGIASICLFVIVDQQGVHTLL